MEKTGSFTASGIFDVLSVPILEACLGEEAAVLGSSSSMILTVTVPCLSTPSTIIFSLGDSSSLSCSVSCVVSGNAGTLSCAQPMFKLDSFSDTLLSDNTLSGLMLVTLLRALSRVCGNTVTVCSLVLMRGRLMIVLFS